MNSAAAPFMPAAARHTPAPPSRTTAQLPLRHTRSHTTTTAYPQQQQAQHAKQRPTVPQYSTLPAQQQQQFQQPPRRPAYTAARRTRSTDPDQHPPPQQQPADTTASTIETDPHRLSQRQKQVDIGKHTAGYTVYTTSVPRHDRAISRKYIDHPITPDKTVVCSKRAFDGMIKKWRKMLHVYEGGSGGQAKYQHDSTDDHYVDLQNTPFKPLVHSQRVQRHILDSTPIPRVHDTTPAASAGGSNKRKQSDHVHGTVKSLKSTPQSSPNSVLNGSLRYDVDIRSYINTLLDDSVNVSCGNVADGDDVGGVDLSAILGHADQSPQSSKRTRH